jgi:hypothetical protein
MYLMETAGDLAEARCTRARVVEIARTPGSIDDRDRPSYYSVSDCTFFFRLADFVIGPILYGLLARLLAPDLRHEDLVQ